MHALFVTNILGILDRIACLASFCVVGLSDSSVWLSMAVILSSDAIRKIHDCPVCNQLAAQRNVCSNCTVYAPESVPRVPAVIVWDLES